MHRIASFAMTALSTGFLMAQGWTDRTASSGPPLGVGSRAMAFDPVLGRSVLVCTPSGAAASARETWTWDGQAWANLGVAPSGLGALVWHAATQQLLGLRAPTSGGTGSHELVAWSGASWTNIATVAIGGSAGQDEWTIGAYDPLRGESVFRTSLSNVTTIVFDGSNLFVRPMASQPTSSYSGPEAMAWDPAAGRVVLAREESVVQWSGSVWFGMPLVRFYEWSGFGWNLRYPASAPGLLGAMATDAQRQRVVMLDGDHPASTTLGASQPYHTWSYGNGITTRLTTYGPAPRQGAAMTFDTTRNVVVLFGGHGYSDTWEFDLGPSASFTTFGSGCPGSRGTPTLTAQGGSLPRIGTTFTMQANNLPWSGAVFLGLGFSDQSYGGTPLPADLGMLGAPGCSLLTSLEALSPITNVLGAASWSLEVPAIPGGEFFVQVFPVDPAVNALGLTSSNAGRARLGL